jgi:hypothetical protein
MAKARSVLGKDLPVTVFQVSRNQLPCPCSTWLEVKPNEVLTSGEGNSALGAFYAQRIQVEIAGGNEHTEAEIHVRMEEASPAGIIRKETPSGTTQIVGRKLRT